MGNQGLSFCTRRTKKPIRRFVFQHATPFVFWSCEWIATDWNVRLLRFRWWFVLWSTFFSDRSRVHIWEQRCLNWSFATTIWIFLAVFVYFGFGFLVFFSFPMKLASSNSIFSQSIFPRLRSPHRPEIWKLLHFVQITRIPCPQSFVCIVWVLALQKKNFTKIISPSSIGILSRGQWILLLSWIDARQKKACWIPPKSTFCEIF